jgi:hypothetical protein
VATASSVAATGPEELEAGAAIECKPSLSTQFETVVDVAPGAAATPAPRPL